MNNLIAVSLFISINILILETRVDIDYSIYISSGFALIGLGSYFKIYLAKRRIKLEKTIIDKNKKYQKDIKSIYEKDFKPTDFKDIFDKKIRN